MKNMERETLFGGIFGGIAIVAIIVEMILAVSVERILAFTPLPSPSASTIVVVLSC